MRASNFQQTVPHLLHVADLHILSSASGRSSVLPMQGYMRGVLLDHRMCLCGMLAAEYETLPGPMRVAVVRFFEMNEAWLGITLSKGTC